MSVPFVLFVEFVLVRLKHKLRLPGALGNSPTLVIPKAKYLRNHNLSLNS